MSGARLFAQYAYAPNKLGYCGPAESATLATAGIDAAHAAEVDVRAAARRFSGAWHYLEVLAKLTGIDDPLDRRIVESYWLGGGVNEEISSTEFGEELLARIAPEAQHYWAHLTPDLIPEAAGDHGFHVLGVYPWTRFLGRFGACLAPAPPGPTPDHPVQVLDRCRIRWGTVLSRDGEQIVVSAQRLVWDGTVLSLSEAEQETVAVAVDGLSFLPDVAPGDQVSLHWEWLCDRLSAEQVTRLQTSTLSQIEKTNRRLTA
ncbi:DUF6390 family protein [Sporichthya sp.]|uniref:DUF6390 family protein n=1 Tax=Sporichthya sp. TaxID=65475 RepID=UPI0025E6D180|nr:DUF6390 family protein [Sporichthya sp.]